MRTIETPLSSPSLDVASFQVADDLPEMAVSVFTDWLTKHLADGAEILDGQTIQIGYSILMCDVNERHLSFRGPDFCSLPVKWVADLSAVFRLLLAHKYLPESFGYRPDIPSLRHTAIIGRRFDEMPMFINRLSPTEDSMDSGWFIGNDAKEVNNNDPKQLKVVSLYEAALAVPHIAEFLSLPVGCQVMFDDDGPTVLKEYEPVPVPEDSFFYRHYKSTSQ